ncbi:hypothetical protein LG325_12185 [Marinobacter nauticus]
MLKLVRMMAYAAVLMVAFDHAMGEERYGLATVTALLFFVMAFVMLDGKMSSTPVRNNDGDLDTLYGGPFPESHPLNHPDNRLS